MTQKNSKPVGAIIKHLGHAAIYIRNSATSLVVDPWFSEAGAFLASWHQFPEPTGVDLDEVRAVDYVVLSHEHLDHFDIEFIKTINPNASIVIPSFGNKYLLDSLSVLPNEIIEVDYKERFKLGDELIAVPLTQTVPIQMDCTWIFEVNNIIVVNFNDMQPTGKDIDWVKSTYPHIDYLFHQFSGANWYPHVYGYDESEKVVRSDKRINNKFHNCLVNFESLGACWLVPSAGPPCFLDDDLFHLNFSAASTFPTMDVFYEHCERKGVKNVILTIPGDVVLDDSNNQSVLSSAPYANKRQYLEKYKRKRDPIIAKNIHQWSQFNDDNLFERFKAYLEPLVEASSFFRKEIGGKVLFDIDDSTKFLVNFRSKKNSVKQWNGEDKFFYRYVIPRPWLAAILGGHLRWEELFLSLRFKAFRDPDVHNQALQTFLYYADDEMYEVYENYFIEERGKETFTLEYEGCVYKVQKYCPHAGADLEKGEIIDGEIICPNHGWGFRISDGLCPAHNSKISSELIATDSERVDIRDDTSS